MTPQALKSLNATEGRVGGYLIVWGSPNERDLQGEYFTPSTDLGLDWYPRRPVLFHHGLAADLAHAPSTESVGVLDTLRPDSRGVWAEATLDPHHPYYAALLRLIDDGVLSWSSGSLPHLVDVKADGRIDRWIVVEGSLTPRPAEPRKTNVHALKSAYDALGLDAARLNLQDDFDETSPDTKGYADMTQPNETHDSAPRKRLPMGNPDDALNRGAIYVSSPYDPLNAADMLHGYVLLRSVKGFQGVSEQYANALAHKIQRERLTAVKADELAHTAQQGYGDEWAADLWSNQLWQQARAENVVLPLFRTIDMPSAVYDVPIQGSDPTVYYVAETQHESQLTYGTGSAIPSSKGGTRKVQLEAKKLALRMGFAAELAEDSVVPLVALYREQAARAIADSIDHALLNGDTVTTANTNINLIDGTPAGSERYLAFDGVRKLPLVTNTALKVSMGAAPTLAKLRETRFKLGARYAARPSDLAWVVDGSTYAALLSVPEFLTMDKAGPLATAQTGQIGFIDGIAVYLSAEMALSDANGKIPTAGGTKGVALCVYRPGWFVGLRRRVTLNVDYLAHMDAYQLTATVRLGFARQDDNAASALVNVTV